MNTVKQQSLFLLTAPVPLPPHSPIPRVVDIDIDHIARSLSGKEGQLIIVPHSADLVLPTPPPAIVLHRPVRCALPNFVPHANLRRGGRAHDADPDISRLAEDVPIADPGMDDLWG